MSKTRLEVVKEKYPVYICKNGMPILCPDYYGFCTNDYVVNNYCMDMEVSCEDCWNAPAETEDIKYE